MYITKHASPATSNNSRIPRKTGMLRRAPRYHAGASSASPAGALFAESNVTIE